MRQFRFRLDPVIRLKEYEIERKEEEIANLEDQIQQRLREIEEGRQAVENLRIRLLEQTPDHELVNAERNLDMFRAYTWKVEHEKRNEIGQLRQEQEQKRRELIKLYQEEKTLNRLKERRKKEWEKAMRKEESAIMDEIGTQKYVRRERERGGVILYLLVPILLAGIAAGAAFMTGAIDKSMLEKIPYLNLETRSATEPVQVESATESQYITPEDLFGPIDEPMPQALQNLYQMREQLAETQRQLQEREKELDMRESMIAQREQMVSDQIKQVSQNLTELKELERKREERMQSELSEREQQMADALAAGNEKNSAQLAISLFDVQGAQTPEEAEENQLVLIRILDKLPEDMRATLIDAIVKQDPIAGSEIVKKFINTDTSELYGLKQPEPEPIDQNIGPDEVTTEPGAEEQLPPPREVNLDNNNAQAGGG